MPNFVQNYLLPSNADSVRRLLHVASDASESPWGVIKVLPLGVIAIALCALNGVVRYPLHAPLAFGANILDREIMKAGRELITDIGRALLSLVATAFLVVCVTIGIFYPKIYQHIKPITPDVPNPESANGQPASPSSAFPAPGMGLGGAGFGQFPDPSSARLTQQLKEAQAENERLRAQVIQQGANDGLQEQLVQVTASYEALRRSREAAAVDLPIERTSATLP